MGTVLVQTILEKVAQKLLDDIPGKTPRWPIATELIGDYNFIKDMIVGCKHDAGAQTIPFDLVPGTKQTLPANAVAFRSLARNLGEDGVTPGREITQVDRDDMDHTVPGWHTEVGEYVKHWIADPQNPLVFYIWPAIEVNGSSATWAVELNYCGTFEDAEYPEEDAFPMANPYAAVVYNGMMAWAHAKNSKSGDLTKVSYYEGRFNQLLGLKDAAQQRFAPLAAAQAQAAERG